MYNKYVVPQLFAFVSCRCSK